MRDGLVGADRATELLALLRVGDRHLQRSRRHPDQLGGEDDHRRLHRLLDVPGERIAAGRAGAVVGAGGVDQVEALELGVIGLDELRPVAFVQDQDRRAGGRADDWLVVGGEGGGARSAPEAIPGTHLARCSSLPAPSIKMPAERLEIQGEGASA